ncbi:MAG: ABC transporter permease [Deltaproteobacteria bacterium]|nr:ABC transporter permease [Deltaproteobacteria bacterium]
MIPSRRRSRKFFYFFCLLALLVVAIASLAPWLAPYDPLEPSMYDSLKPPSSDHAFGTDRLGRDLLSRILYGARISLAMTLSLVIAVCAVGTFLGAVAGFVGGKLDSVIMRVSDITISFPSMILAIAVAGMLGPSMLNAGLALAVVSWTKYARLSRSLTLKIVKSEYIAAAVVTGSRRPYILRKYILPNALPTMIVTAAMDIGTTMLELAGLSFLGFGAQLPTPEWGVMLNEGRMYIQTAPWLMIYPGVAIFIVVSIFNLLGDGLRDVLDPFRNE